MDSSPTGWIGGRVHGGESRAEAIVVEGGRVVAVGTERQVRAAAPTGTVWHPLAGRLLVPGLIDPHLHWLESVLVRVGADLRGCDSLAEMAGRLASAADRFPGGPLVGGGWDEERLVEGRRPTRSDLDRAVPDRPTVLLRICQHVAVANSSALASLGIDARTTDPPGGRIERDAAGEPTGVLVDNALSILRPLYANVLAANEPTGRTFLAGLTQRGLTLIGCLRAGPAEFELAARLGGGGLLPLDLRLFADAQGGPPAGAHPLPSDRGPARWTGVKLVLDGSLGARTAWLENPYADRPDGVGLRLLEGAEADRLLEAAIQADRMVAIHAIGDAALREAIRLAARCPERARIEHASVVPPALEDALVALRSPVVIQPGFLVSDTWLARRLGDDRVGWAYPFRRLADRGVVVAASSDAPVESADPWVGMRILVERAGFSPEEALACYTRHAARTLADPARGRLAPGSAADLVIVDAPDLERAIRLGGPVRTVVHAGATVAGEGAI
jgi:predicted amidohydrolase YtcJ